MGEKPLWETIDPNKRRSIFIGLLIAQFLVCLSGTILSTSVTPMIEELGGFELFSWMFTAYLLTQAIGIPMAGKLSDIYGRRIIYVSGLAIFTLSLILCGMISSLMLVIVFRALQGLGGGMMIPVINATVADVYPPGERARIQGIYGSLFGIGLALGPVLGGVINDLFGWRWVFFINVPFLLVSLFLCLRSMPSVRKPGKPSIDFAGIALISCFLLVVLIILSFCGGTFAWASLETVVLVVAAIALICGFILTEKRVRDPVIDLKMFGNKVVAWACIGQFVINLCTMGATTYIARYFQGVLLLDATTAGFYLLPFVAGMLITSLSSGFLLNRTGYRIWLILGPVLSSVGLLLIYTVIPGTSLIALFVYMFILGFGSGCLNSILVVAVQNNVDKDMGMAMSGMSIFRSMGTTVSTAFMMVIINLVMAPGLGSILPPDIAAKYPLDSGILDFINTPDLLPFADQIRDLYASGIGTGYLICGILVLLVLILVFYLKDDKKKASE